MSENRPEMLYSSLLLGAKPPQKAEPSTADPNKAEPPHAVGEQTQAHLGSEPIGANTPSLADFGYYGKQHDGYASVIESLMRGIKPSKKKAE